MASATVGALRVVLSADSAAFSQGLKGAEGRLTQFGNKINASMKELAAFGALATAAAAAVAAGLKHAAEEADALGKSAQKVGMATDELSKLKYAAEQSGVSFEGLNTALVRLSKSMSDAAKGTGEAKPAFDALGLSVLNADGSMKSSSIVLEEVAGKFANLRDGTNKTALAVAIFGRAGADLIPMLNAGADGIEALKRRAEELGIVIDDKTFKAAEKFNDALADMQKMVSGGFLTTLGKIAPLMERLAEAMADASVQGKAFDKIGNEVADTLTKIAISSSTTVKEFQGLVATIRWLDKSLPVFPKSMSDLWAQSGQAAKEYSARLSEIKRQHDAFAISMQSTKQLPGSAPVLDSQFSGGSALKPDAPNILKPDASGSSGSADTSAQDELERERRRIMARLDIIRQGFLTEEAMLLEKLEKDRNTIDAAYQIAMENQALTNEQKLELAKQHNLLMEDVEKKHQDKLNDLQRDGMLRGLSLVAKGGKDMANAFGENSEKMVRVAKIFGAVEATVNAYRAFSQTISDPSLPWFAKIGAASTMLAAGLSAAMSIRSASPGSSGGGVSTAGGGSAASAAAAGGGSAGGGGEGRSVYLTINGSNFSREQMREMAEGLSEYVADGGKLVMA